MSKHLSPSRSCTTEFKSPIKMCPSRRVIQLSHHCGGSASFKLQVWERVVQSRLWLPILEARLEAIYYRHLRTRRLRIFKVLIGFLAPTWFLNCQWVMMTWPSTILSSLGSRLWDSSRELQATDPLLSGYSHRYRKWKNIMIADRTGT